MKKFSYIGNLLVSLDQLGNALCGGYADTTISARLGYAREKHFFFHVLASLVDWAFSPVEPAHCYWAWRGAVGAKDQMRRGNDVAMIALVLLVAPFLIPIHVVNLIRAEAHIRVLLVGVLLIALFTILERC